MGEWKEVGEVISVFTSTCSCNWGWAEAAGKEISAVEMNKLEEGRPRTPGTVQEERRKVEVVVKRQKRLRMRDEEGSRGGVEVRGTGGKTAGGEGVGR